MDRYQVIYRCTGAALVDADNAQQAAELIRNELRALDWPKESLENVTIEDVSVAIDD